MNLTMLHGTALVLAALGLVGCAAPAHLPVRPLAAAAPSNGVTHATGTFQGRGGVELFEQSWRPEAPPRAVLVAMHGPSLSTLVG